MKTTMTTEDGRRWIVRREHAGGRVEEVPAVTLSELAKQLKRSRRQLYRCLKDGKLLAQGKVLGEWLVQERGAVYAVGGARKPSAPIPLSARVLFPEYKLEDLHPVLDASVIVPRILENGDRHAARWVLRQYSRAWLARWMREEGWQLTRRSAKFWAMWLGVPQPKRRPGGIAPWSEM